MWLLFGRKKGTGGGNVTQRYCPNCGRKTPCREIVEDSSVSVWFVPVHRSREVKGYVCMRCGSRVKSGSGCVGCVALLAVAVAIVLLLRGCF